jgi:adenylate kinase family enzyme
MAAWLPLAPLPHKHHICRSVLAAPARDRAICVVIAWLKARAISPQRGKNRSVMRVAVVGCIGAGKSRVATRLGAVTRPPVLHLDRYWWQDGRYRINGVRSVAEHTMSSQAFRDLPRRLAAEDAWIIDGGYIGDLDTRLTRADTVVFLDLPRRVCLWRLVRRHGKHRADYPAHVQDGLGWLLALIRWVISYPSQKRPAIEEA